MRKTLRDYWFLQRPLQEDRGKAYLAENSPGSPSQSCPPTDSPAANPAPKNIKYRPIVAWPLRTYITQLSDHMDTFVFLSLSPVRVGPRRPFFFANRWFWPVPAWTPRAICIWKMCIDDLERAGWGVGWHDLGTLGVGRADGTRGPADRRGAPRVGERPANAGGLSGSLPTRVWGAGDPQHSAPIQFHTEGLCSHLDQTGQHRLSIMFDLLARS